MSRPFNPRFTTPLYMGSMLNPINSSLIATALVAIAVYTHMPAGRMAVLISSLYLASSIAQPTAGKLSEVFGPRRVFLGGITLVFIGGLIGGFGHNLAMLIAARVVIGLGTSAGYPSAMLMIRRRAQDAGLQSPPGGVLGGLQIAGIGSAAFGLPIGGVLVAAFGWRSMFFANIPVATLTLMLAVAWLPADAPLSPMGLGEVARRIDVGGIVTFAWMMIALLVFIDGLPGAHWLWLAISAVGAVAFVGWERRASQPFIDIRLLASNRALCSTYLRFALMSLCIYTVLYSLTEWLEIARGISTEGAGLVMLPCSLLAALMMRPIASRNLIRVPLIVAAVSAGLCAVGLLTLHTTSPLVWIIIVSMFSGVTMATYATGNQTALYGQALPKDIGTASGLLRTSGYLGSIGSSAILSIAFHSNVGDAGLHHLGLIMIGVSAVALLFTLADRSLRSGGNDGANVPSASGAEADIESTAEAVHA